MPYADADTKRRKQRERYAKSKEDPLWREKAAQSRFRFKLGKELRKKVEAALELQEEKKWVVEAAPLEEVTRNWNRV